jgi:hypothetical protein
MKSENEIRNEIERINQYRKKWPCVAEVKRECDLMVEMLKWVLGED